MMELYKQLPHLEPYGDLQYFLYVIVATLPIFIGLFFKKRFALYEVLVSLFFIVTMLVGGKTNQISALILYVIWQVLLVSFYKRYRKQRDSKWIFYPPRASLSRAAILLLIFPRVSGVCSKPVPKHLDRILPIHAISPMPPVQGVRQALTEVTGVALQWGSE